MLALRLAPEVEERLSRLAATTGRTKSFYAREAIAAHLAELEERYGTHLVEGAKRERLMDRVLAHRAEVIEAARRRGVTNVRIFGSAARGDDGPESDLDVLVDAAEGTGVLSIIALQHDLEDLLGVSVDVAPADALKPLFRERALAEAVPL